MHIKDHRKTNICSIKTNKDKKWHFSSPPKLSTDTHGYTNLAIAMTAVICDHWLWSFEPVSCTLRLQLGCELPCGCVDKRAWKVLSMCSRLCGEVQSVRHWKICDELSRYFQWRLGNAAGKTRKSCPSKKIGNISPKFRQCAAYQLRTRSEHIRKHTFEWGEDTIINCYSSSPIRDEREEIADRISHKEASNTCNSSQKWKWCNLFVVLISPN